MPPTSNRFQFQQRSAISQQGRGRSLLCCLALISTLTVGTSWVSAQVTTPQVRSDVNAEWVESSSPLAGGGRVTTTQFPQTNQLMTKVIQPTAPIPPLNSLPAASLRPQIAAPNGFTATPLPTGGYAPIPTGNGAYLIPTVSYVPMSSNALASYQAAYLPPAQAACPNCQIPTAPAYQPTYLPAANQTPILPTAGTNLQVPMTGAPTGFYSQPAYAPAAQSSSGYKALIPRALPAGTYIGQGWAGQPKAYVNDQPFRNFLRYLIVP